jgi:hypothetical protein
MERLSEKLEKNRFVSGEKWKTASKSYNSYNSSLQNQVENKSVSLAIKDYIKVEFSKLKR